MAEPSPLADGERLAAQGPWLALLLRHLVGPGLRRRIEIDDFVQETLLRALSTGSELPAAGDADDEAALRRLLAHIARHVVIDALRHLRAAKRNGRELRLEHSDWSRAGVRASSLAAVGAGPATQVGAAEDQQRLVRAFEGLSAEHRRVIGLRQLQGLSAAEAGERMGKSATAIHSLYRRALAAWSAAAEGVHEAE